MLGAGSWRRQAPSPNKPLSHHQPTGLFTQQDTHRLQPQPLAAATFFASQRRYHSLPSAWTYRLFPNGSDQLCALLTDDLGAWVLAAGTLRRPYAAFTAGNPE